MQFGWIGFHCWETVQGFSNSPNTCVLFKLICKPEQNNLHFVSIIFKYISGVNNVCILIQILLKCFPNNKSTLVQVLPWCQTVKKNIVSQWWPSSLLNKYSSPGLHVLNDEKWLFSLRETSGIYKMDKMSSDSWKTGLLSGEFWLGNQSRAWIQNSIWPIENWFVHFTAIL